MDKTTWKRKRKLKDRMKTLRMFHRAKFSESEITSSGSQTDSHLDPVVSSASAHSEHLCTEDTSSQHSAPSSSYEAVQYDSETQNLLP